MTKVEFRNYYLDKRKKLSAGEKEQLNLQLYHHFFSFLDLSFIHVLHTYLPIEKNNEPDTWMIIDRIRREFPHIRISVPRVGEAGELENFYFEGLHQLKTNGWNIQEPKQGIPTPTGKIDAVIVPLLAFDKAGHRVGYGKGFYDRFLKQCRGDCKRIGLSFFDAVEIIADADVHDIRLTTCITPITVLNFGDLS